MTNDINTELALANKRASRYKKARDTAEQLLESKSRDLFDANQQLQVAQAALKNDIAQGTYELSVTNQRLQKSLEEKSNFIGQMSHEVRTPLNAIIGLSEILLRTSLDEEQLDYVSTISSGADSLITLLDDMLDITKIEAGRVELNPEAVDMRATLKSVVTMFTQAMATKGLSLSLKISSNVPNTVSIDSGRYKQIVNNLINNAVKNTEQGGIVIQLSYAKDTISDGVGMLTTRVVDTGVGIPKDKLQSIFNAYEQLGQPGQGIGLGLSICQQLSELMMGKISCHSTVGQGSVFESRLPAQALTTAKPVDKKQSLKPLAKLPPLKILVAEDNPTNQKVITAQLAQLQLSADIANNGSEALAMLDKQDYDVLICDILMPVMDGEQTIRAIRSSKATISSLYCIALTASNFKDQRERLLKQGFDAFLSKPASLQQLLTALQEVPQSLSLDSTVMNAFVEKTQQAKPNLKESELLDFSFLKSQFGDAYRSVFVQIAPSFLEHAYKQLSELEAYSAEQNFERVAKTSHSIKGAASSLGLTRLADVLEAIEKNPSDPSSVTLVDKVRRMMTELKPVIEREISES